MIVTEVLIILAEVMHCACDEKTNVVHSLADFLRKSEKQTSIRSLRRSTGANSTNERTFVLLTRKQTTTQKFQANAAAFYPLQFDEQHLVDGCPEKREDIVADHMEAFVLELGFCLGLDLVLDFEIEPDSEPVSVPASAPVLVLVLASENCCAPFVVAKPGDMSLLSLACLQGWSPEAVEIATQQ